MRTNNHRQIPADHVHHEGKVRTVVACGALTRAIMVVLSMVVLGVVPTLLIFWFMGVIVPAAA